MTKEVQYIIENKKFKRKWEDFLPYWEFLIPMLIFFVGLESILKGKALEDYALGLLLMSVTFFLTSFGLLRARQMNDFEEIRNTMTKEDNFNVVLQGLKSMGVVEVDRDIDNWTISAKYKTTFLPPVFEWLTIVCQDNKLLINSRPTPGTFLLWLRRNAIIDLKRLV